MTKQNKQRCLFVGRQIPSLRGHASELVIARHLIELKRQNWQVTIAVPGIKALPEETDEGFSVVSVCRRSWWWPPTRFGWKDMIWSWVWACEIVRRIERPDLILSHLTIPTVHDVAGEISRRLNCPLGLFVHDNPLYNASEREEASLRRVGALCSHCWCVTEALCKLMGNYGCKSSSQLLPVPSELLVLRDSLTTSTSVTVHRRIAIIGTIYNIPKTIAAISQAAQCAGYRISVVASPTNETDLGEFACIDVLPFFSHVNECIEYVKYNCDGVLIPYPMFDDDSKSAAFLSMSFPSRLVEFSKCGLPVKVLATSNYEIADWLQRHIPSAHLPTIASFRDWLVSLAEDEETTKTEAQTMLDASESIFAAEEVQRQFMHTVRLLVS